jgi:hydrogenase-4 component F
MIALYLFFALCCSALAFGVKQRWASVLAVLAFLSTQLGLNYYAWGHLNQNDSIYFSFDALGFIFTSVLSIISLPVFYHSYRMLEHQTEEWEDKRKASLYTAALIILVAVLTAVYFADNYGILWVLIECSTIALAALIYFYRTKLALEATWKYIFLSSIGISLVLISLLFLNVAMHRESGASLHISAVLENAKNLDPLWLKVAFALMVTGLSTKMGVFPFHTVGIDATMVAPHPVNVLMSTALKNAGFVAVFRLYQAVMQTSIAEWASHVLLLVGLISIALAATQTQRTLNLNRMLGYSGLEHVGLALVGLSLGQVGFYAAVFHLVLHSFAKAGLFLQMGQVNRIYDHHFPEKNAAYFHSNPIGSLVVLLGYIGVMALPPSGLFSTELMIFSQLAAQKQWWVLVLALFLMTIVLLTLGRQVMNMLYGIKAKIKTDVALVKVDKLEVIAQITMLGLMIYIGFNPPVFLVDLLNQACVR